MKKAFLIGTLALAAAGVGAVLWSTFGTDEADLSVGPVTVILRDDRGTQIIQDGEHLLNMDLGFDPEFFVEAEFKNLGTEPTPPNANVMCHVDVLDLSGTITLREMSFGVTRQFTPSQTEEIFDDVLPKRNGGNTVAKARYSIRCEANEDRSVKETAYDNNRSTLEFYVNH